MSDGRRPFEGLRVLDIASWIAAPVAATILGDLGADVIKIEPPGDGDPYRTFPENPAFHQSEVPYTWIMDGRAKRSLTVNLKSEEGREIVYRLVRGCDVFVTNQPFRMRERFGLRYEDLAPLNERMIYASLTAYGEEGPERESSAFDQVAYWARSGLCDLLRAPGTAPTQGLPGMGDHPTGVTLFASIVTALYRRERTGRGGLAHTSLHANGLWSNSCLAQATLAGADFSDRRSGQPRPDVPVAATHVLYEASDGRYVQFNMVRTEEQGAALYGALGLAHLLEEERFSTMELRGENGAELVPWIRERVAQKPAAEWLELLNALGVPASPVVFVEEVPDDDQAKINGVLMEPKEPLGVPYVVNHPVGLGDIDPVGAVRPPEVGEHSGEILRELGYESDDVERLRRDGVI